METLRELALEAYDKLIGLQLCDVAVDDCITKAPCGGQKTGRSPVDRGKQGMKRSTVVDANGIPIGAVAAPANRHDSPLLEETLDTLEKLGEPPEQMHVHLDREYDSRTTREKLKDRGLLPVISEKGKRPSPEQPLRLCVRWPRVADDSERWSLPAPQLARKERT